MKLVRPLTVLGLALGSVAVLLLVVAGPGHRLDLWHFRVSFQLMRFGAYAGITAVACALAAGVLRQRGRLPLLPCVVAAVLGAAAAGLPAWQLHVARSLPPIHDLSTDTATPPAFVAVVPLRGADSNPLAYGGAPLAAQQQAAYPDLQPLVLDQPQPQAFAAALRAAEGMGWQIVGQDAAAGRIEATATTFWFGFKDDVAIRVAALEGSRSRVDVRSVSRVGQSDLGANAARIRRYLDALRASR